MAALHPSLRPAHNEYFAFVWNFEGSTVQVSFGSSTTRSASEPGAMTLAEIGDFDRAAAIQRGVRDAAQKAGLHEAVARMESNLREYEQRRPCRTPWRNNEALYLPASAPP